MALTTTSPNEAVENEPGMEDNRLSLNPNDPAWKDTLAEWEDGEEYPITDLPEGTMIRQISPGEFAVVPPVAAEAETEETEEAEEPEEESAMPPAPSRKSKAAAAMMG